MTEGLARGRNELQGLVSRIADDVSHVTDLLDAIGNSCTYADVIRVEATRLESALASAMTEAGETEPGGVHNDVASPAYRKGMQRGTQDAKAITDQRYQELMHSVRNPLMSCGGFTLRMQKTAEGACKDTLKKISSYLMNIETACIEFNQRHLSPSPFDLVRHLTDTYGEYASHVPSAPQIRIGEAHHVVYHDQNTLETIWRGIFNYIMLNNGHSTTEVDFRNHGKQVMSVFSCPFPVEHPLKRSTVSEMKACGYENLAAALGATHDAQGELHIVPRGSTTEITVRLPYRLNQRA